VNAALWLFWVASVTTAAQAAEGDGAQWARSAVAQAVAASSDVQDSFHRVQSLAQIAETQAAIGESAAALPLLQLAAESVGNIDSGPLASWARHDIALAWLKAGEPDRAEAMADGVADLRLRDSVLAAVADVRRADHNLSGARAAARRMQDSARQGQALRSIAIAQVGLGDMDGALATARSIVHPVLSSIALADVVSAFAKAGNLGEARMFAARIRDDRVRGEALVEIVSAQADAGDIDGALAGAKRLEDKFARAEALGRVAAASMRFGSAAQGRELFAQAIALASGARGPASRRIFALIEIARAEIAAGETAAARETLQNAAEAMADVKRNSDRLAAIQQIAPLQARVGDHAAAMATAWQAEDPSIRPLLMRDVAASRAEAGDIAGAVQTALALEDRPTGAAALLGILRVQSQSRDSSGMRATIEAALQIVRVMRADELKAGALASLAAAQLIAGDGEAARSIYEEAMNVAALTEAGPARAAAFARIADALGEPRR
jgi:tetratricopeptide (TPR) repeat protein